MFHLAIELIIRDRYAARLRRVELSCIDDVRFRAPYNYTDQLRSQNMYRGPAKEFRSDRGSYSRCLGSKPSAKTIVDMTACRGEGTRTRQVLPDREFTKTSFPCMTPAQWAAASHPRTAVGKRRGLFSDVLSHRTFQQHQMRFGARSRAPILPD